MRPVEVWEYPCETEVAGIQAWGENVCRKGLWQSVDFCCLVLTVGHKSDPLVQIHILLLKGNFIFISGTETGQGGNSPC